MSRFLLSIFCAGLVGLVGSGCAPNLVAVPHLVAVWPAAGAVLPIGRITFELTFNHTLDRDLTWATVASDEDGSPVAVEGTIDPARPRQLNVALTAEAAAGAYRLHWHAVAARTAAAADGEQTFSMRDESSVAARVEVSHPTADVGEALAVSGTGFGKRCSVQLSIGDDEQALGTVTTDDQGSFEAEVRVPQSVPFGEQPLLATDGCGATATAVVRVRWGGWPPLVAFDVGRPGPDAREVTFAVTLRNRSDYVLEHVRVVVRDPPGASYVIADPVPKREADSLTWEIATIDRGVLGPFRVTYRATGAVVNRAWIEFRHRHSRGCNDDDCLPTFLSETTSESAAIPPAQPATARRAL